MIPIYTDVVLKDTLNRDDLIATNHISKNYNFDENKGRIACNLSHRNALLQFKKTNEPYCLIFEDDNKIPYDNEVEHIHNILNHGHKFYSFHHNIRRNGVNELIFSQDIWHIYV